MIALLLAQTIAITGGTVYPVSGPKLANASVLIRDGRIVAVGTSVSIPPGVTRIDASGKWVTPGLIDGAGQLGLVEIGAVSATREGTVQGDTIAAAFNVAEGINPASTLIPVTRIEGITTALAVPSGNLVSGQAVLIDLDGVTIEQMVVRSPVGIVADLSESGKDDAGVPVLVEPMDNIPGYDSLGIRYENAALLAKAGVTVALLETDTHQSRNLRQQAGNAVAYGMTWDQALRAVTLSPAEIFGVADRYGSLEPGKVANVVVWSGDPFEFTTGVEHVLIRGKEIPLKSRQTELFERYKKLPPTY